MLDVSQLIGFGAGLQEPRHSFVGAYNFSNSGGPSRSVSGVALGADSTKILMVCISNGDGFGGVLSSATIAGVAASVSYSANSGFWENTATVIATGVAAQSGDIVLTWSSAPPAAALVAAGLFSTNRELVEAHQVSQVASSSFILNVGMNPNNRLGALGLVAYTSQSSQALASNPDLIVNYTQVFGTNRFSFASGVKNTGFSAQSSGSVSAASLRSVTLF